MGEKKKILLVENERIIALDIKRTLESQDYVVLDIIFNSALIYRYVSSQKPDLLITSVKGIPNFAKLMKKITTEYCIPILLVTGLPEVQLEELKNIEGCSFLKKPYEQDQLIEAVNNALNGTKAL
jgi:DNA-binding NtrC family response regulator